MNSTPPKVIYMVIGIMGAIAFIGVASLCATLFWKNYADPAVLTSIISITSGALGSLGTMLVSTRSQAPGGTTTATLTTTSAAPPPPEPATVIVANEPSNPVPTTDTQP
jgi:hypothetical protein